MIKRLLVTTGVLLLLLRGGPLQADEGMRLTLAEAEKLAVKNNPELTTAVLTAAAAAQFPAEQRAAYLPALTGNATGVVSEQGSRLAAGGLNNPIVYNRFAAGVSLSQLITDFGRTTSLIDMARLRADAQNQAAEQTRADIVFLTGQAYFSLLRSQAVLQVARQTIAERQLVADQISTLARSNLKSALDVSFANVNLDDAKLLLVQAENLVKAGQAQLATLLGVPGDTTFILAEEPLPLPLPDRFDGLVSDALRDRPELKRLHLELGAAEKFTRAEHALHYPTIGLLGAAGYVPKRPEPQSQGAQPPLMDHYGAVGINVTIPIFNGGLFKARETEADLRAQAAKQQLNDMEAKVARDVRVACLNEKTACDRVALTEQMLKQAQTALDLAQSRYSLGLSSIVELSQAQLNLTSAQISFASARYDCQAQRLNVDYQVGALR